MKVDLAAASQILDLGARIGGGTRAQEQLEGAVAVHNLLEEHRVAVLADEVGMGKTYVALGALALFRHFNPSFRVLVLAPRENLQEKWTKELRNFVSNNVRFSDLRVRALDGRPARPLASCEDLLELVHETGIDPHRDFFARLTSFSLPLAGRGAVDPTSARQMRDRLRELLPWLPDEIFDLRSKEGFKDNMARAICCGLPEFDLVICDESHNLKHGFSKSVAARNRVLALAFGHPEGEADPRVFPTYAPRAKRVLFLSATPLEESFLHLWNQLDVFGLGKPFAQLRSDDVDDDEKKEIARRFLIRRVTAMRVNGEELTKNLYRREWRRGGVSAHDEPISITDTRSRLVVALVQKKVTEVLGHERFNASFQIGMLASFESFLETAKVKKSEDELGNFDGTDQTEDDLEKEGIDVASLNRLATSYRRTFGEELPHPKMDAVVASLKDAWKSGQKALVFVRRVASVRELKRKLDDAYDRWLLDRLRRELPSSALELFERAVRDYRAERTEARERAKSATEEGTEGSGTDTFFAWFFRGEGPRSVVSGANVQKRLVDRGGPYAMFFEHNYVADLLGVRPGEVEKSLSAALGVGSAALRPLLQGRAKRYLSQAKKLDRGDRFEAFQAAAVELLKEHSGAWSKRAGIVWSERFESSIQVPHAREAPEVGDLLEAATFFTELRQRKQLRDRLWPAMKSEDERKAFREEQLRGHLLAAAARLGHAFIDLYVLVIGRIGDMRARAQDSDREDPTGAIRSYLDLLENQQAADLDKREWVAFDELAAIADNYDLILDTNEPYVRSARLAEAARLFGSLLRQQQPVGGMSGQVNKTLVRQFRMPGYPHVLVTTDLLQEGEDLHTFCSAVHHYGVSWTPSAMEQRIGRIDRVRSQTDRGLSALQRGPNGHDFLQVYFPHLEDTVEVLQVRRVLERMNKFLRLMHEGLKTTGHEDRRIDTAKEFLRDVQPIEQIRGRLHSAFPVQPQHLRGEVREPAVVPAQADALRTRFAALRTDLPGINVEWDPDQAESMLLGTAFVGKRRQPFTLLVQSASQWPVVRCVSPVGCVTPEKARDLLVVNAAKHRAKVAAILTSDDVRTYDLSVEADVILPEDPSVDAARVGALIRRVVTAADSLEQDHLPGKDEPLETFRTDLGKEADRGR